MAGDSGDAPLEKGDGERVGVFEPEPDGGGDDAGRAPRHGAVAEAVWRSTHPLLLTGPPRSVKTGIAPSLLHPRICGFALYMDR